MTNKPLAAFTDAYHAGLVAVGLPNGPRVVVPTPKVHPSAPYDAAPVDIEKAASVDKLSPVELAASVDKLSTVELAAKVVAQAQASDAANISAQRIEEVRAQCVADTSALIAGQYKRL